MARVLSVDDQPHMSHVIAIWLKKNGHEVVQADNGVTALELLRSGEFDVLVTDVDMPHMDGLTLISHRDAIARLRGVIVLTGRHDYEDLRASVPEGKAHVLPKPFSPSRFMLLVHEILSHQNPASATSESAQTR